MDGIVILDKPEGISSNSAANRVKKILGAKKAGHAGTLDPMASGVLVVLLGKAARLSEYIMSENKEYKAQIKFGLMTDTLDVWGEKLTEQQPCVSREQLLAALKEFQGESLQVPPSVSAIKIGGTPLYKYAREGKMLTADARSIFIHSIEMTSENLPYTADINVVCSKGTYIRSLCRDIGEKLSVPAVMSALVRTASGKFRLTDAVSFGDIEAAAVSGSAEDIVLSMDDAADSLIRTDAADECYDKLICGNKIYAETGIPPGTLVKIYCRGRFCAVGITDEDGIKPHKVLADKS